MKKPYEKPICKEIKLPKQNLLCSSCDNPYWEDNQPDEDNWWKK